MLITGINCHQKGIIAMSIRIVYNDNSVDTVPFYMLQLGIECNRIKMFYRESEKRWVNVESDPVRALQANGFYQGPERRIIHLMAG